MKLIFESQEEFDDFVKCGCPSDIPTIHNPNPTCPVDYDYQKEMCTACWKSCELELEVKND